MKYWIASLGLLFLARPALAELPGLPRCVSSPEIKGASATVRGFPGQRVYLYPKHLRECEDGAGPQCKATAYVIAGDQVEVSNDCDAWRFVTFNGPKTSSSGWVPSRRLTSQPELPLETSSATSAPNVLNQSKSDQLLPRACRAAADLLNAAALQGMPLYAALPSALQNSRPVEFGDIAKGVLPEFARGANSVEDVIIGGQNFKAYQYTSGGTCYSERLAFDPPLNLPELSPSSEQDLMGGYNSELVVSLDDAPRFVISGRASRTFTLFDIDADRSMHAICRLGQVPLKREFIRSAIDSAVCNAALDGKVEDVAMQDIRPFGLTAETLRDTRSDAHVRNRVWGFTMVSRGTVDLDNDNQSEVVGMLQYQEDSGAGCGSEYHAEWPVVLDSEGLPQEVLLNRRTREHAGSDDDSRLFRFNGATYFEHRSRPLADEAIHEIWKFSSAEPIKVCEFAPVHYEVRTMESVTSAQ